MQLAFLNATHAVRKPGRGPLRLKRPKSPKKATARIIPLGWRLPSLVTRRAWARRFLGTFSHRRFLTVLEPLEGCEAMIPAEAQTLDGWRFSGDRLAFWTPTGWTVAIPEFMAAIPATGPLVTPAALVRLIEITES